jgi:hypothetical protein
MWHDALDAAESGEWTFPGGWEWIKSGRNEERLAELPPDSGPNRINTFVQLADEWLQRTSTFDPDRRMPGPLETVSTVPVTVGLFTWFVAAEWHLHALDFGQVIGEEYRTPHAQSLYEATLTVFGRSPRGGDRWDQMLKMMGRQSTGPTELAP